MMEFYREKKQTARLEHVCAMCSWAIEEGTKYYRENGKYNGRFFSRCLHIHCHNMECEYCDEVDNEFSWEDIVEYIEDKYCSICEISEECRMHVSICPKLIKQFSDKEDKNDGCKN